MTKEELAEIIKLHGLWIVDDPYGKRANLQDANLYRADLQGADLRGANLDGADLRGANLYGANLQSASLYGADLRYADLQGAVIDLDNILQERSIVPQDGSFIAYKAGRCYATGEIVIIKLEIPASAKRLGGLIGRKCRASEALVLDVTSKNSGAFTGTCCSDYDRNFIYKVGERVFSNSFNEDPTIECANGIHFFINRQEAVEYLQY